MNSDTFRLNFPPNEAVPDRLEKLLAFQNTRREWYSGHFELTSWKFGQTAWFDGDKNAAEQFIVFGQGPDGSLYALWLHDNQSPANAPVVFLGSEGTDCGVLARNLDDFLSLLATGADELGFTVSWGGSFEPEEPAARLGEFRDWLRNEFSIVIPPDPMSIVTKARAEHPDLEKWIQGWQESRK